MKALGIVKKKFPQLVCVGCATHTGDLLNEDVGSIPEFAELVKQSLDIAKFIKGCKYVSKAFKRIIGKAGRIRRGPGMPRARAPYILFPLPPRNNIK